MSLLNSLKRNLFALLAGLLFVLLSALQPALAGTPIDKTVTATADGDVRISSVAGSVKIEAWNRNQIHISGTLSSQAERLAVEKTASGVTIRVVLPQNTHGNDDGSHLVVQLPAASNLRVSTISADVSAGGTSGPLKLETVSGEIKLGSKSSDISTETVSGETDIAGSAPQARISAHSISGGLQIHDVGGELRAETVSGDITLGTAHPITRAKVDTTSGDIGFVAALTPDGSYEFNSVSGGVKLRLPAIPTTGFDASSFSGDITSNFGPAPQHTSEFGPGKEWRYRGGSGKGEVRIQTMSGDIQVRASNH